MSIIYARVSSFTGKKNRMHIPMNKQEFRKAHNAWTKGMLIQDAFPKLNASEREFIMTGSTPEEWAEMFGEME